MIGSSDAFGMVDYRLAAEVFDEIVGHLFDCFAGCSVAGCAGEVVGFDAAGGCVVSPPIGVRAGGWAVSAYGGEPVDFVCGDAVDVWAVDPGGVVDGAVEVGVLEQAEVECFDARGSDMGHDTFVFDFVEIECSLEGGLVADDCVLGGVVCGA